MQQVSDLHLKFALRRHHVWKGSMADIQSAAAEIRREKKETKKKNKPQHENIMVCPIP